jgi:hypothetical protein
LSDQREAHLPLRGFAGHANKQGSLCSTTSRCSTTQSESTSKMGMCDPSSSASGIRNVTTGAMESRIENFMWTGSLARDPKNKARVTLILRSRDVSGGGNFRPLAPITIDDTPEFNTSAVAEKLVANFAQTYEKSQYKIFLHFETEALRKSLEQKRRAVLSDGGYTVVGSDPPDQTIAASWVDYFFPEDCQMALEIRRTILSSLPPGTATAPFIRNKEASNRPGTVGIWLSSKQIASPPIAECR